MLLKLKADFRTLQWFSIFCNINEFHIIHFPFNYRRTACRYRNFENHKLRNNICKKYNVVNKKFLWGGMIRANLIMHHSVFWMEKIYACIFQPMLFQYFDWLCYKKSTWLLVSEILHWFDCVFESWSIAKVSNSPKPHINA